MMTNLPKKTDGPTGSDESDNGTRVVLRSLERNLRMIRKTDRPENIPVFRRNIFYIVNIHIFTQDVKSMLTALSQKRSGGRPGKRFIGE
jgi:hypothetical protein